LPRQIFNGIVPFASANVVLMYENVPKYRPHQSFCAVALVDEETCGSSSAGSRSGKFITSLYAHSKNGRDWNARQQIYTG
jgi:hypothetical protein